MNLLIPKHIHERTGVCQLFSPAYAPAAKYGKQAAEILDALLTKYADSGLTDLENVDVLKVDPIKQYGTQVYIVNTIFGGIANFRQAIKELEAAIYAA